MRIIMGLTLSLLYIWTFSISYIRTKDVFSPLCFFAFMQFVGYVPGIFYFKSHLGIELNDINTFYVFIFQVIVALFTWLGSKIYREKTKDSSFKYTVLRMDTKKNLAKGLVIYSIGFIFSIYFIYQAGGVAFIMSNTQLQYTSGKSYLYSLQILMPIGIISLFENNRRSYKVLISFLFIIYSIMILILTKRAPVIEALMLIIFAINYKYKRIRLLSVLKPKVIIFIIIFMCIIIIMPEFRSSKGFNDFKLDRQTISNTISRITTIFVEYSYTSRDAFVYSNYNVNNMYYGRTIVNLITAPLPRSVFPWKPPVDDGLYLANYVHGYYITPPSNFYQIYNSFPFSSQGSLYANFGVLGIILGSLLMGLLYEHLYKILIDTQYNTLIIIIYQIILYKFAFSAKNVTQSLIVIIGAIFIYMLFYKIKIKKESIANDK